MKRKPILMVRRVGEYFEYYIQEGNKKIHFTLYRETHEDLKQLQLQAEMAPQRREGDRVAIPLRLAGGDQKP